MATPWCFDVGWFFARDRSGAQWRSSSYRSVYGSRFWWQQLTPPRFRVYVCQCIFEYVDFQHVHHVDAAACGPRGTEKSDDAKLAAPLLLGIAYAASIGGIGTPIGTPPNMVFMGVYTEVTGSAISFGQWMMWAVPVVVVLLPIAGFWITRGVSKRGGVALPSSGEWTLAERRCSRFFCHRWVMDDPQGSLGWMERMALPAKCQ